MPREATPLGARRQVNGHSSLRIQNSVTGTADDHVDPSPAIQDVNECIVPHTAIESVGSRPSGQRVVAAKTDQQVTPAPPRSEAQETDHSPAIQASLSAFQRTDERNQESQLTI